MALELGEQVLGRLAEQVDQHVQPAAVRHADHDVGDAPGAGALHQFVEQRYQRVTAFERKTLLSDVTPVQIVLQALGGSQVAAGLRAAPGA